MAINIAVWGNPGSGKTTMAIKLAKGFAKNGYGNVILVFADDQGSPLNYAFEKLEIKGSSLGALITSPNITEEDVLKTLAQPAHETNLGLLGYGAGESFDTFPVLNAHLVQVLYKTLDEIADVIITDCSTDFNRNLISRYVLKRSDRVITMGSCDNRCLSFFRAMENQMRELKIEERQSLILNNVFQNDGMDLISDQLYGADFGIEFDPRILRQSSEGKIIQTLADRKKAKNTFEKAIEMIISLTGESL